MVPACALAEPSVVAPLRAMKPAVVSSARSMTLATARREMAAGERAAGDRELGTRAVPSGRLRKMTCRVRAPKLPRSLCELHPVGDRFRSPWCLGLPFLPRASSRCHAPGGQDSASRACRLAHVARTSLCLADSRQLTGLPTAGHAIFWLTVRIFWRQWSQPGTSSAGGEPDRDGPLLVAAERLAAPRSADLRLRDDVVRRLAGVALRAVDEDAGRSEQDRDLVCPAHRTCAGGTGEREHRTGAGLHREGDRRRPRRRELERDRLGASGRDG